MPSIKCTNCGAVLKTQAEIPAGKKVKCPKCSEAFVVPAEEAPLPPEEPKIPEPAADDPFKDMDDDAPPITKKKGKSADPDDVDEGVSEGEAPVKKKRRGRGDDTGSGDSKPAKKSNATLYIILGVVAGLLSCCLCVGIGGCYITTTPDFQKEFNKAMEEQNKLKGKNNKMEQDLKKANEDAAKKAKK